MSGAVADLGVFVPLSAALVLVNGLEIGSVLIAAGLLVLVAGLAFGIPFPVQPLKALTALAVAQDLSPDVIRAAGLSIGVVLLLLTFTGLADRLALVFTHAVIRALQLGVGALLAVSAVQLVLAPPAVFERAPSPGWGLALAGLALAAVAVAAWRRWYGATIALLLVGTAVSWIVSQPALGAVELHLPDVGVPPLAVFGTALVTLVVPQLPLTYGNAVVGVSDLAREHFGDGAGRVTPNRVALSCGVGNVAASVLGGMPMCHGSSGLSAHLRLGARTSAMNALLGGTFLFLGLVLSGQVLTLFGLMPVWVLAGFLAYAGLRHALLVLDLRGASLATAVAAASVGIVTGNLAYTTATALVAVHGRRALAARRAPRAQRN